MQNLSRSTPRITAVGDWLFAIWSRALERGDIDATRLARWYKLSAEERFNSSSLAERKTADKSLHKMINLTQWKNSK
jgi:hypothetical protein